jgi:hypothetical protein
LGGGNRRVRVVNLDAAEHRRLLVDGPDGLELAAF